MKGLGTLALVGVCGVLAADMQQGGMALTENALRATIGGLYWDECTPYQSCEQKYIAGGGGVPAGSSYVCWIGDDTTVCYRCRFGSSTTCGGCSCTGDNWAWCVTSSSCNCGSIYIGKCDGAGDCGAPWGPPGSTCGAFFGTCCP